MKYFVPLFLSLFFLVFMSCGNEDNALDNNIPINRLNFKTPKGCKFTVWVGRETLPYAAGINFYI